jgi:hypothetical protein
MSRKKRMQNVREAKDRRAKKLAIGGAVVLVALLAWEVPHFLGGKKAAAPAATTTATTSDSGTTTPTTAPATATGVPVAATPATSTKLPNSDMPPRHSKQQLTGFSTFASKDPFLQQVTADTGTTGTASTTQPSSTTTTASRNKPVLTSARTLARSGAVRISVNGRPESVRIGARLVSVTRAGVRIGIANGSYSSGAQTVSLALNRTVTLVDSTNGVRYKLQLLGS